MQDQDAFSRLLAGRASTRAFLETQVEDGLLQELLVLARKAPSGSNLQPGTFIQVRGEVRRQLSEDLVAAWRANHVDVEDYDTFPRPMPMALRKRQVAAAQALYASLGIARDDRAGRDRQFERNFRFFDAPVAMVVSIDQGFGPAGHVDLGMALYGLMLAAQSRGLASCAIGAIAPYSELVRRRLALDERARVVCGFALGYADPAAPVNRTRTVRGKLDEYFRVAG